MTQSYAISIDQINMQWATNHLINKINCWSSDLLWLFILYMVNGTIIIWQIICFSLSRL